MKTTLAAALAFLFLGCSSEPPGKYSCLNGVCYPGIPDNCDEYPECKVVSEMSCFLGEYPSGRIEQSCREDAGDCQMAVVVWLKSVEGGKIVHHCTKVD